MVMEERGWVSRERKTKKENERNTKKESSNFITTHLHSTNADKVLVVIDPVQSWCCDNHFLALSVCGEDEIAYDLTLGTFPLYVRIVGSCNGLVCVQGIINHSPAMVLWNPATRQFRYLEPHSLHGIAFLPDSHDYKLLAFQDSCGKEGPGKFSLLVNTLSSDSWRSTEIPPPSSYFCSSAVELNGVFHWLSYVSGKQKIIVSFDRDERLCRKVFYGGISGLKQHFARQDRRRFSPCPYVSTDIREEMRMHLTSPSQHNNDDEFDEDFASSTSEMTIQGQDGLELERYSDYGKSEPL
ncbi:hypothetical protein LguiB_004163 [Lonicera macranthoides]